MPCKLQLYKTGEEHAWLTCYLKYSFCNVHRDSSDIKLAKLYWASIKRYLNPDAVWVNKGLGPFGNVGAACNDLLRWGRSCNILGASKLATPPAGIGEECRSSLANLSTRKAAEACMGIKARGPIMGICNMMLPGKAKRAMSTSWFLQCNMSAAQKSDIYLWGRSDSRTPRLSAKPGMQ